MGYLDQNLKDTYALVVMLEKDLNYKVVMSPDGTVVTTEKTSLPVGVYEAESDIQITDNNIKNSVVSLYNRDLSWEPGKKIIVWIAEMLLSLQDEKFLPIHGIPKMTKALANNLSSVKEAMVLYHNIDENRFDFLCFGYRRIIAQALKDINPYFVFADRFFTAASFDTRFKQNIFAFSYGMPCLAITNNADNLDRISLVMCLAWEKHTDYLEKNLID